MKQELRDCEKCPNCRNFPGLTIDKGPTYTHYTVACHGWITPEVDTLEAAVQFWNKLVLISHAPSYWKVV